MKVSKNWLQQYVGMTLPDTSALVAAIGAQLGAVEEVVTLTDKYALATIVRVVECSPLPNSDHLNLCFIDDGQQIEGVTRREDGLVQVVCGAPNVAAGVTVVWLPPGATVPSSYDNEPFVLEARPLRGTVSNGMLASAKELAIGDSHEGLLLLDDQQTPGTSFATAYELNDDIIDIENKMFTHRPDCFGQLGVAREVAGILGHTFVSPDWYHEAVSMTSGSGLPLTVHNEVPQVVPRFMAVALDAIQLAPSPLWLQTLLSRVGVRPINNVVDVTNYLMLLTGQPLHAYDYDKVAQLTSGDGAQLTARFPKTDETLTLLNGKTITPRAEAIMIATDGPAIGLGGVMGGGNTEVDSTTTRVILECASFDMYAIRRTSMAHGLFTDAVTRFNKGQSPLQNAAVLAKAVSLLEELASAKVASEVIDDQQLPERPQHVAVDVQFINDRLGLTLSSQDMAQLLINVECPVQINDGQLVVTVPFWRTDLERPEDIVEEVGRLYGFDKLPLVLPQRSITPAPANSLLALKSAIRHSLVRAGANELLTYSFVHGDLLRRAGQNPEQAFKLSNALSPDLQYFRLHGLPSLLDKVHANSKAGYGSFMLFEMSKGHNLLPVNNEADVPAEIEFLDAVYASRDQQAGAPYYAARRYLDALARDLGLEFDYQVITDEQPKIPVAGSYDLRRSAYVRHRQSGAFIGMVGEFKPSVIKAFKLPAYSAGFSVGVAQLLTATASHITSYQPLPRFPKIEQDICFKVPTDTSFAALDELVWQQLLAAKPEHARQQVQLIDIYQRPDDTEHKQITFRISLASYQKTMTDEEMSGLMQQLTAAAKEQFQAERL